MGKTNSNCFLRNISVFALFNFLILIFFKLKGVLNNYLSHTQLSADIKIENNKIKTGINLLSLIFNIGGHDFSAWLISSSYPADFKWF